jgi:hypothetical protein
LIAIGGVRFGRFGDGGWTNGGVVGRLSWSRGVAGKRLDGDGSILIEILGVVSVGAVAAFLGDFDVRALIH